MAKKVGATARATVTVEIYGLGSWGAECSLDQVHRQAAESAIGRLQQILDGARNGDGRSIRIVGEPNVTAVLVEQER